MSTFQLPFPNYLLNPKTKNNLLLSQSKILLVKSLETIVEVEKTELEEEADVLSEIEEEKLESELDAGEGSSEVKYRCQMFLV